MARNPKPDPPDPDDPRYARTCNLCGTTRRWVVAICRCGGVEFSIPEARKIEVQASESPRID